MSALPRPRSLFRGEATVPPKCRFFDTRDGQITHTFTVRATDRHWAGRRRSRSTYEVIDWMAYRQITVRTPVNGAEYPGRRVESKSTFECADEPGGSGIEVCDGELHARPPARHEHGPGSFTKHFFAVDRAHNITQKSGHLQRCPCSRRDPSHDHRSRRRRRARSMSSARLFWRTTPAPMSRAAGDSACASAMLTLEGFGLEHRSTRPPSEPRPFMVTAKDGARDIATLTRTYQVVYPFTDFAWPASPHAGDDVPLRISRSGQTVASRL